MVTPVKFDHEIYLACIKEVEAELLRIGATECNHWRDQSQLSAVIFLLIRATSLLRSVLSMLVNGPLDACDAVRRAYLEAWLLAFEFRLEGSGSRAAQWHKEKHKHGSVDIKRIENYVKSQGIRSPMLGNDYGGLSKVAHPTKYAAENSVAVVAATSGDSVAIASLIEARAKFQTEDLPMTMYRFLWLVIEEREGLIKISANMSVLPVAMAYMKEYEKLLSESSR
jgi:hypothetical protein